MNRVHLIGRVAKDFEVKATPKGTSGCMFTIAVDDGYGENKRTNWPQIVVWGKAADNCGKYLHKGSKVAISGKLQTRDYERDGRKVYVTEVVADMHEGVEFLDPKPKNQQQNPMDDEEVPF